MRCFKSVFFIYQGYQPVKKENPQLSAEVGKFVPKAVADFITNSLSKSIEPQ